MHPKRKVSGVGGRPFRSVHNRLLSRSTGRHTLPGGEQAAKAQTLDYEKPTHYTQCGIRMKVEQGNRGLELVHNPASNISIVIGCRVM